MTDADFALNPEADDQALIGQIVDYYQSRLQASPEALAYLRNQGVTSSEAVERFRIGYSDRTLGPKLPRKKVQAGRRIRDRLEALGFLSNMGDERFRGCLVFPIPAADGSRRVVDLYGWRLYQNSHKIVPPDKHLNDKRQGVWNVEAFGTTEDIILLPSLWDALAFWGHGYRNVTCLLDPEALTDDHLATFKQFNVRRVLTPCAEVGPRLVEAGLDCLLMQFPPGQNAHTYAAKADDPAYALGEVLHQAKRLGQDAGQPSVPAAPEAVEEPDPLPEVSVPQPAPAVPEAETPPLSLDPEADDQKLLAQIVAYYHQTFKSRPEGLGYLKYRGITNSQVVDHFRIGYSDRTLGLKLPPKATAAGKAIRSRLETLGVFRNSSGHEHYNGSVTFPVFAADGTGRIMDLFGRKTRNDLRKGTPLHMHLAGDRQGVWNIEALAKNEEIILLPSLFDAFTFWSHGYRNVTCIFGKDALTDDHLAAFQEFNIRRVVTPCEAITPKLLEAGMDCYLIRFPVGHDANAYALRVDNPQEALGAVLRKAEWIGKGHGHQRATVNATPVADEPAQPAAVAPAPQHDVLAEDDLADAMLDEDDLEDEEDEAGPAPASTDAEDEPPLEMETVQAPIASPLPPVPKPDETDVREDEVVMTFGNRRYRVRGLAKNLSFDLMRVNVLVSTDRAMFVDTFDLYSARHRKAFVMEAARELAVEEKTIKKDLGRLLLKLEELQDEHIAKALAPKEATPTLTQEEKDEAMRLLRDPKLLDRILADFQVVGENTNKLVGYLAAVSRKLDQPLAVIIQSASAAGKTALMEAVLEFVPPEDQVKYSAMTGQSLFYMGETNLKHKILAIMEEEGAERASYALKLLQSEGELMIASTGKDSSSGRLVTQEYRVEGPVMIFLTTTAIKIDEELLNRCIVLTVDEDREQTKAIHQLQRRRQTLPGLLSAQDHQHTLKLHHNAQRLLRPLLVANPYAEMLTFLDDKTRTRRDHLKYLTLIRTLALFHQHQRPVQTVEHHGQPVEYIEVALEDIEMANRLANEVLGRSIDDLPPQTRRLLNLIDHLVTQACQQKGVDRPDYRFSRRDIRTFTGWGHTQLKVHLKRLEELEYLLIHRGGRGQSIVYELLYDKPAEEGQKFLARLIDVDKLRQHLAGPNGQKSANGRLQVGVKSAPGRPGEIAATADAAEGIAASEAKPGQNGHLEH